MSIHKKAFIENKPSLFIKRKPWLEIQELVEQVNDEVGFLGIVTYKNATNEFSLDEIFIPTQIVTASTVSLEEEGLDEVTRALLSQGKKGLKKFSNMLLWGHSHVNMGVTPSGVDIETMRTTMGKRKRSIMIIFNKSGSIRADLWINDSFLGKIVIEELVVTYEGVENPYKEAIEKVIKEKVSKEAVVQPGFSYSGGYEGGYDLYTQEYLKGYTPIKDKATYKTVQGKNATYREHGVFYEGVWYNYYEKSIPQILIDATPEKWAKKKLEKSLVKGLKEEVQKKLTPLQSLSLVEQEEKELEEKFALLNPKTQTLFRNGIADFEEFLEGSESITNAYSHWVSWENSPILQQTYTFFSDYTEALLTGEIDEGVPEESLRKENI